MKEKISAALVLVIYLFTTSPIALFAEDVTVKSAQNEMITAVLSDVSKNKNVGTIVEETSSSMISAEKGGTVVLGNASVEIPAGALPKDTEISITRIGKISDTGDSLYNAVPGAGGYRFLPAGTKFSVAATVTIPYDPILNTKRQSLEDLYTYFYDTEKSMWVQLERLEIDEKRCVVKSSTTHFTDMINATLTMPETAEPIDVNLNSIKNLEAASPDSHLIKFNPPKASAMGDMSFSFDLTIPSGRNGVQPQLSVSYSSGNGNGIMGKGFDLSYGSCITTDTRKNLPNYNGDDTYILDGVILRKAGTYGNGTLYKMTREGSFLRIVRYRNASNDYWKVTDKAGVTRTFGDTDESCVGSGDKKFTWNLTKVEDARGNNVIYKYTKTQDSGYSYIESINYTGKKNSLGSYRIDFIYGEREDVRIDGRSREFVICDKILNEIKTSYKGTCTRTYSFSYDQNSSSMMRELKVSNVAGESYSYTFDYMGLQKDADGNDIYFDEIREWDNGKPLSTGNSANVGGSFNLSGGVGFGTDAHDIRITAGGSVSFSTGDSSSEDILIDINGDGLVDSLECLNGKLYAYLNNGHGFDGKKELQLVRKVDLGYGKNSSSSVGWNIYGGAGASEISLAGGVSYSQVYQNGSSVSNVSFADMDRDGYVDIIESGKDTYLRNNGNLSFSEVALSVNIANISADIPMEIKNEYEEQYFVQTPFRMWQAPYDGEIEIKENARRLSSIPGKYISVETYFDDSDQEKKDFKFSVPGTQNKNVSVKANEDIYFIANVGDEPKDTDIQWDINISYKKAKVFDSYYGLPLFVPKRAFDQNLNCVAEKDNDILKKLITITNTHEKKFKFDWEATLKDSEVKEVYKALENNGLFIPSVLTREQFEKYVNEIKNIQIPESYDKGAAQYYLDFANHYTHYLSDDLYVFSLQKNESAYTFYDLYPMTLELKLETIKNYEKLGLTPVFLPKDVEYSVEKENIETGKLNDLRTGQVSNQILRVGSIESESGNKSIDVNLSNRTVLIDGKEESDCSAEIIWNEDKLIINLNMKRDDQGQYGYCVYIVMDKKSNGAKVLTQAEYVDLKNKLDVPHSTITDSYWQLKTENKDPHQLLADMKNYISDADIENFIAAMYEKDETGNYKEKTFTDGFNASKVLETYKNNWIDEKLTSVLEYNENMNVYLVTNPDQLAKLCQDFASSYYKYSTVSYTVKYNRNYCYDLIDDCVGLIGIDDGGNLSEKLIKDQKFTWNSANDFSNKRATEEICIYECNQKDNETFVSVNRHETMYGDYGSKWFYGIWKGSLNKNPFEIKKLSKLNSTNEDETKKTEINKLSDEERRAKGKAISEDINYYAPIPNEQIDGNDILPVEKNSATERALSTSVLMGTVYVGQKNLRENGKHQLVTNYYMPYIDGNIIHADRVGGDSYYNIDGLADAEKPAHGLPAISKTFTDGTDGTWTYDFSVNSPAKTISDLNSDTFDVDLSIDMSVGGNTGKNDSTSETKQFIQDMNGDGIPDIVQSVKGDTKIFYGSIEDGNVIDFSKQKLLTGSDLSTVTKSHANTSGASGGPSGSVSISPKDRKIIMHPSSNPSAGQSSSTGTNTQTKGLIDINGDGLPDYFNGKFLLGNGTTFESVFENYGDALNNLLESKIESSGNNFTLSKGFNAEHADSLKTGVGVSSGISLSLSSTTTESMMMDMNGDGLQDIVSMEQGSDKITVKYNMGNKFSDAEEIHIQKWTGGSYFSNFKSNDDANEIEIGFMGDIPIVGSFLKKKTIDRIDFISDAKAMELANSLDWSFSSSIGISGNLNGNVNSKVAALVNVTTSAGGGVNGTTTVNGASVRMMDLDGDGMPDHVLRIPGKATYWKRNLSGQRNLIKSVNLPQGGSCSVTYCEMFGTVENPGFRYAMGSLTMDDGCGSILPEINHGEHSVTTTFSYSNGYYDREMKEFFGYETVTTRAADGSYSVEKYNNDSYYLKGTPKEASQFSSDGQTLAKSNTLYMDEPLALPRKEESTIYEIGSSGSLYSSTDYEYDGYGNVVTLVQSHGDGESLTGKISYSSVPEKYIYGLPVDIVVAGKDGEILRHRSGSYNDYGEMTELKQYFDSNGYVANKITYNTNGSIMSVVDGRNAKVEYKYDSEEEMFPVSIIQSGNGTDRYEGKSEYDIATQTKTYDLDCGGNKISYKYDSWQRVTEIWTDYDSGNTPAVRYEYFTPGLENDGEEHSRWYAVTYNKVLFDGDDGSTVLTVLQKDGVGRTVMTAKSGCAFGENGWNVSGVVEYDSKGRTVKEGMAYFVYGGMESLLESEPGLTEYFTSYEYDERDRQTKTVLPDGSVQKVEYGLEENILSTKSIDPLGNISVQKQDGRGNVVEVERRDSGDRILMSSRFEYNSMGEMLNSFIMDENSGDRKEVCTATVGYDLLGRRTYLESPDSGRQEFFYDQSSNLLRENNSVLRESGNQITYKYDGMNRLIEVEYPFTKHTVYEYAGAGENGAGKIKSVSDAGGVISYVYGSLGEVVKESRTLDTHIVGVDKQKTAVMEYRSDYLGRMQSITYPDGEKVVYGYDNGGQVKSVHGIYDGNGNSFDYVTNVLYDERGQRARIEYGNGTSTDYKYDPARLWLESIKTDSKSGKPLQNIKYGFDLVGNVSGYTNDCYSESGNYSTSQSYTYDSLYQIKTAHGETMYNPHRSSVPEFRSTYDQSFSFDELGRMLSKVSSESVTPIKTIGDNLNYSLNYTYDGDHVYRLKTVGDRKYEYDSNGNIVLEKEGANESEDKLGHAITNVADGVYGTDYGWGLGGSSSSGKNSGSGSYSRSYTWDERNMLTSSNDGIVLVHYVYGQDGQRCSKYTVTGETLYFNNMWTLRMDGGNMTNGGQTGKNIYLGDTRIVTKLNSGKNPTHSEELHRQYFYHSDHLGSASLITDWEGNEYQRIEYTPYGETWVDKTSNTGLEYLPYKFSGKELDEETGLYYYGARYLDPKYSMWLSTDPALGEYIPKAPIDDDAKKYNQKLPGMGGVFNLVNGNLYHYAGNNPVKYTDPDGMFIINNTLLYDKTKQFAFREGKNSFYLNGGFQPTIFSNSTDMQPGFPHFSLFEKNIGFSQRFENALIQADNYKNDNAAETKASIKANAVLSENGIYEIKISVTTNVSPEKTNEIVAYAGENEIMTDGKIDQKKINAIANYSINTVMRWKNDKQNVD